MIRFAENLNKMIAAGLGGAVEAPRTEVAVGHRVIYTETSGDVVNFETNVIAPVKNLRVTMEPIQEGTGDPSPDNIRPISGRESVTVTRTGVNLFNKSNIQNGYIDNADGQVKGQTASIGYKCTDWIRVNGGGQYYIMTTQTAAIWGAWYDKDKTFLSGVTNYVNAVITAPQNAYYCRLTVCRNDNGSANTFAINYPSTDHDYHAYDGQSVTIQLGQTVYGGTVDLVGGNAESTWTIKVYDGSEGWAKNSTNFSLTPSKSGISIAKANACITNYLPLQSGSGFYIIGFRATASNNVYARVSDTDMTLEEFIAYLSKHPLVVCYKAASSATITTTPQSMTTLKGTNNVWSDAGDVTLEYSYHEETEGY